MCELKSNITQAIEKIEIYVSIKKINQQEHTKNLGEKSSTIEGTIMGQIWSIHYNKNRDFNTQVISKT